MTWVEITVLVAAGLFIGAFLLAVVGVLTDDRTYHPMSPDEEYRMLTDDYGLTPEEAEEIMDDSWRERLRRG